MPDTLYFVDNGSTVFACDYRMAYAAYYGKCRVHYFTNSGEKKFVFFTF